MPQVLVKCLYCNKIFDRNVEPCQKIGRRYAHQECYERNYTESDEYKEKIYDYVKKLFGANYKYLSIESQRKNFIKKGMTNKGIYYTLKYHFEVRNGSVDKSEGRIGIVPYLYEEAQDYYNKLNEKSKNLEDSIQKGLKERVINIESLEQKNPHKEKIDMNSIE